jgi:hypothetical protein
MNGIFTNYLRTMYWSVFGLKEWVRINLLNCVIFPAKIQISKPLDMPYIHDYVWFKDDRHVIWMWIWLILKNISLLDRIWSLWLVRIAHSPTNFIFWLNRLIFSVSINSYSDTCNIYSSCEKMKKKIMIHFTIGNLFGLFYMWYHSQIYTLISV